MKNLLKACFVISLTYVKRHDIHSIVFFFFIFGFYFETVAVVDRLLASLFLSFDLFFFVYKSLQVAAAAATIKNDRKKRKANDIVHFFFKWRVAITTENYVNSCLLRKISGAILPAFFLNLYYLFFYFSIKKINFSSSVRLNYEFSNSE